MSTINIQENIPLSRYTTFKIGGPAKFFCEVKNEKELEEAVRYAKDNNLAAFIIGGGSNLLVSDGGFPGLVIRFSSQSDGNIPPVKMRLENGNYYLECWAGESLASIVKLASDSSLTGLEWAAGIPGTIGGAVRGNAGVPWGSMSDSVESVKIFNLENSKFMTTDREKCQFEYRNSVFKKNDHLVIISVRLRLQKTDNQAVEDKINETLRKRGEKQPQGFFSPGSFFANPVVKDSQLRTRFERDTGSKCQDDKIPAGWLIAEAGLLGKKIGGTQVSEEHGNFVVNIGGATAQDVIMLVSLIKQRIRTEFGVQLKEEVQYLGL